MKKSLIFGRKKNTFRFFGKKADNADRTVDEEAERLKQQWLREHEVVVLPPGWSRYGYQ